MKPPTGDIEFKRRIRRMSPAQRAQLLFMARQAAPLTSEARQAYDAEIERLAAQRARSAFATSESRFLFRVSIASTILAAFPVLLTFTATLFDLARFLIGLLIYLIAAKVLPNRRRLNSSALLFASLFILSAVISIPIAGALTSSAVFTIFLIVSGAAIITTTALTVAYMLTVAVNTQLVRA